MAPMSTVNETLGCRLGNIVMYWQPVLILIILKLTFLMQVVFSASLSSLLLLTTPVRIWMPSVHWL